MKNWAVYLCAGAGSIFGAQPIVSNIALDTITHTSVRVSWTLNAPAHVRIRFGTSAGVYPYATYSLRAAGGSAAIAINALTPSTTYYLRVTARPNYGDDVDICQTDSCGSLERILTTLPEPSRHPEPPLPPAPFDAGPPDTTGYVTVAVSPLSDGSCDLQAKINQASYGTVIEIPQETTCRIFPSPANSNRGLKLPVKPLDARANGNIDSPDHRWIVIRTASGPKQLPPAGLRVTPQLAAPFARLVAQAPAAGSVGDVMFTDDNTTNCAPNCNAHHYRIEMLEMTHENGPVLFPQSVTDPRPFGFLVALLYASPSKAPVHIVFDRIYVHGRGAPARVRAGMWLEGRSVGLTNSTIDKIDFWRPVQVPDSPALLSPDLKTLTIASKVYQRRKTDAPWTMPGPATARLTADAGYTGSFVGYLGPDGLTIQYTVPSAGQSVAIACENCTALPKTPPVAPPADPLAGSVEAPPDRFRWFTGTIANGQFNLTRTLYGASKYASEGSLGIYGSDGRGPYLFDNNYMEAYGINYFIDAPGGPEPMEDITFRHNTMFWNQDHRITSATSNGYFYAVRNMWEIKRGVRVLVEGNTLEGNWAGVNQGSSILISSRPAVKAEYAQGIRDVTIRSNVIRNASAGFYCQGVSQLISDPPAAERVLIENNLLYGINQWEQDASSPNGRGDNMRILSGCHDVAVKNNTFGSNLGSAPYQMLSGYVWNEGLVFNDNIMYLNLGAFNFGGIGLDSSNDAGHPYIPAMPAGTYKNNLDRAFVRIGQTVETSYEMRNNVIIGGVRKASKAEAAVDLTASEFAVFRGQYPAGNLFPDGATKAAREGVVRFADVAANDYRLRPDSPYQGIGIDAGKLEASRGIVTKIAAPSPGFDSVVYAYQAPDERGCVVDTIRAGPSPALLRSHDGGGARDRRLTVPRLETASVYSFRILCYYEQVNDSAHPAEYPADQITSGTFQTLGARPAQITSPAGGATLTSSGVTFQWSAGAEGSEYFLAIGRSQGQSDLYGQPQQARLSVAVPGLPTDGSLIYVRLSSTAGGVTQYKDYVYTAFAPVISADSVTPSGSGPSATFTAVYGDTAGIGDLAETHLMLNASEDGIRSCKVRHQRITNTFSLWADTDEWQALPAGGSVQNNQCTLNAAGTEASGAGNTLTLTVALTFKTSFSGPKSVYLRAANNRIDSGWTPRGTWTVLPPAPTAGPVSPPNGTGSSATFTAVYEDTSGYRHLHSVYLQINGTFNHPGACYIQYHLATDSFYLANDRNEWRSEALKGGSMGSLQNSQCRLNGAGTSALGADNRLTLTVSLAFTPAFLGAKAVYGGAKPVAGPESAFQRLGDWTVVTAPVAVPRAESLTVDTSQANPILKVVYGDPSEYGNLHSAYLLVTPVAAIDNACFVKYQGTGKFFLAADRGAEWLGPLSATGSLQNSQCKLNGTGTSALGAGSNLTVQASVSFQPAFSGPKSVYGYALSEGGLNSGWQRLGSLTVEPPAPPAAESVGPSEGTGTSQEFTAVYSDGRGYAGLHAVYLMINSEFSFRGSCLVQYRPDLGEFYLSDDAGGFDQARVLKAVSGRTLQNSQCTLSVQSPASGAEKKLTIKVLLSFKTGFTGPKTAYLSAKSTGGVDSPWLPLGTWTVTAPGRD